MLLRSAMWGVLLVVVCLAVSPSSAADGESNSLIHLSLMQQPVTQTQNRLSILHVIAYFIYILCHISFGNYFKGARVFEPLAWKPRAEGPIVGGAT